MQSIIQIEMDLECDIHHAFDLFTVNKLLEEWLTQKARDYFEKAWFGALNALKEKLESLQDFKYERRLVNNNY